MNNHLYGNPKGLPLTSLAQPSWVSSWQRGPLWHEKPSARIIKDELFLRVRHTLEGRMLTLVDAVELGKHCICVHVATGPAENLSMPWGWSWPDTTLALIDYSGESEGAGSGNGLIKVRKNAKGWCRTCLTDYTTTIECAEVREATRSTSAPNGVCIRVSLGIVGR